jgi:hypothetical protein
MRILAALFIVMTVLAFASPTTDAHFKLLAPQSWIMENNLGDPQKLGPCGGTSADGGMPTNFINKIQGGQKLHLKLQETVFHPGHYRVALSVNSRAELPADPQVVSKESARGPQSVSAAIDKQPKMPVLADGLFPHTERTSDPWETDVDIPNINCPKCTLQIVQFMAEHGLNKDGGYFYHHCADLQITADTAKPIDRRWPAVR